MKFEQIRNVLMVSAVALAVAYTSSAIAAPVQIGSPVTLDMDATVENTIDVVVTTPINFGTIGAISDGTDTATLTLSPAGVVTEDPGTGYGGADPAAIVMDPSSVPTVGAIAVTAAFENTELYVTYQNVIDLANGGRTFEVTAVVDDLATPGAYDGVTDTMTTIGHETTDIAGALSFNIGASITTDTPGNTAYPDGNYDGGLDIVFSY